MQWTQERLDRLTRLADGSRSARELGAMFDCSRNAIIGKLLRGKGKYGKLSGRQVAADPKRAEKKPASPRVAKPKQAKAVAPARPAEPPPPPVLPAPLPIPFIDAVDRNLCLHFVGDPFGPAGPDMPVCGAERAQDAPYQNRYCRRHRARQFQVRAA